MDGREGPADAEQVVEVMDVMRIPVVLTRGAKVAVFHADLLEFFANPAEFLVNITGRDQRAVGVVKLLPVHLHRTHLLTFDCHGCHRSVPFCYVFVVSFWPSLERR